MQTIALWFILRIITSFFVALVSPLRPLTDIENTLPLWPPSESISLWLERVLLAPWLRWDAVWYVRIVTHGYNMHDGTTAFHPLYPLLATFLARLKLNPVLSLLLISSVASLFLLIIYNRLAQLDLQSFDAHFSTLLLLLYPASFVLFAPYPEALFLLWAVLCLYWARKRSWWLAGLAGGFATLTRQQGIFLLLPLTWEIWEDLGQNLNQITKSWRKWLALSPIPTALFVWFSYRSIILDDFQPDFSSVHSTIYSFISPSAVKVVPGQHFTWPWRAIGLATKKLFVSPDIDLWVNLILGVIFLILMVLAWKKMIISYRIYTISIALISFSYHTGPIHPYMGLPRHLMLALPVFIGVAQVVKKSWHRLLITGLSLVGLVFLILLYVLEAWVP